MEKEIFDYKDYKAYLNAWIEQQPQKGRGIQAALARALKCQTAHVSQVLKGGSHFSLEHGDAINRFLAHSKPESRFFLLLIQLAKAGTPALRQHFTDEIDESVEAWLGMKSRMTQVKTLSSQDQSRYYSGWEYAAVHVLVAIPEFQTREKISQRLGLPPERVSEILDFLTSIALVKKVQDKYQTGEAVIFLPKDSMMVTKHHINWHLQAIRSIEKKKTTDTHLSGVIAVSREDARKIRSILTNTSEKIVEIMKESIPEVLQGFDIDFYML